jgi:hypothetical protein
MGSSSVEELRQKLPEIELTAAGVRCCGEQTIQRPPNVVVW